MTSKLKIYVKVKKMRSVTLLSMNILEKYFLFYFTRNWIFSHISQACNTRFTMLYLAQNQLVSGYKRDILFWSDSLLILMSVTFYIQTP